MMQMAGMGMMDPMMMMQMAGMGMMGNQQQFHQNPQSNNRPYTGGTMSFDANNKKRQVKPVHGNDDGHKDDVGYQNNKDDHGEENEEVVYSTIEERQKDMD